MIRSESGRLLNQSEQEALRELRALLFGPEQVQIDHLQRRLDDPELHAEDVSQALPDAILISQEQGDERLEQALGPLVGEAVSRTINENRHVFVEAIYPVIGPAIRRAIAQAMAQLIERTNTTIDQTFTPQGLRWRWEAWRSGSSVAEVALRHSLIYRVERVLLIHRETGLLLANVARREDGEGSESLIAAMLTAIQDFARDSLSLGEGEGLSTIAAGDRRLWVEQGPHAVLAAVVHGEAPVSLRDRLADQLEVIHRQRNDLLREFSGDAAPFEACRGRLTRLLEERHHAGSSTAKVWVLLALVFTLLAGWIGHGLLRDYRRAQLTARLEQTPGIVVLQGEEEGWPWNERWVVSGLKDPLAPDPSSFVSAAGLRSSSVTFRWRPYLDPAPGLCLPRARDVLAPPEGVKLSLSEGVLRARGAASHAWKERAQLVAPLLPGIQGYDDSGLEDRDLSLYWSVQAKIDRTKLSWSAAGADGLDPDALANLARDLRRAEESAVALRIRPLIQVALGPADPARRRRRWEALRAALRAQGAPAGILRRSEPVAPRGEPGEVHLRLLEEGG